MTSTELAVRTGSSLTITPDQDQFTDKQMAALRQLGVDNAGPGDLAVFLHQAQRTGLDPFAKQIYMIGRWSQQGTKYTIQTGIDGYRLIARRACDRNREPLGYGDTLWCGPDGQWTDVWLSNDPPAAAKVTVLRGGQPFTAVALWREYVQTVKDKSTNEQVPNAMWSRMGANQLAKCAEALALRKAFPHDLSGIYTSEEMGQADNGREQPRQQAAKPTSLRDAVAARQTGGDLRTEAQATKLAILIRENDLTRDEALPYFSSLISRDIASTKELTRDEASTVIDALEHAKAADADPVTGEVPIDAELVDDWPTTPAA